MGFNKKVLSKAVSELDKAKAPAKPKDITVDPMGYWNPANQGKPVRVPGQGDPKGVDITMHKVNQPIWAQPNVGPGTIMYPEENRHFSGASYVDETPISRKGGTLKSKKYSKSISATNKLFAKNKLFKSKKSKIFDPNAEFQEGGVSSLEGDLISKVIMNRNRDKGFVDRAYALGANPGTSMFNVFEPDEFGQTMSHKMAWGTDDNGQAWMFPTVLNPNNEAIPVPNQYADYISSQGYKNATGMNQYQDGGSKLGPINLNPNPLSHYELNYGYNLPTKEDGGVNEDEYMDLTDKEIQAYRDGGYVVEELPEQEIGGYVQHELVKVQKGGTRKPLEISDPKKYAFRKAAYDDSLKMYNLGKKADKYFDLANNSKSDDVFTLNVKLHSKEREAMKDLKNKSKAKFNDVYAKQKAPIQPVIFKNSITNINYTKSKSTPSKKDDFIDIPKRKKFESPTTQFEKQKTDDSVTTDTDIVPEGYRRIGNLYTASRDEKTGKVTEKEKFMYEPIPHLDTKPIQQFTSPEQTIIPGKPYVKPKQYSGPRYGSLAGDENLNLPVGYTQQEREAARRKRDAEVFQRKNLEYQEQQRGAKQPVSQIRKDGGDVESWEDELDDNQIEELRRGGYVVEELD